MKTLRFAAAIISLTASSTSFSMSKYFDDLYYGSALSTSSYDVTNSNHHMKGNLTSLSLIGGVAINPYFDVEGRFHFGLINDDLTVDNQNVNAKLSPSFGLYAKAKLGMFDVITPYALFGYAQSTLKTESNITGSVSNKDSDISYGLGVEFNFYPVSFYLEYLNYLDTGVYGLSGISLGLTRKF